MIYRVTIGRASGIMKCLANTLRLKIFFLLTEGELCVCQLEEILAAEQSMISHCLRKMRAEGIVDYRNDGKLRKYFMCSSVSSNGVLRALKKELERSGELDSYIRRKKELIER